MGEIISLAESEVMRQTYSKRGRRGVDVEFYFDLSDPFTYLFAERIDRTFGGVSWLPTAKSMITAGESTTTPCPRTLGLLEQLAGSFQLPLVLPKRLVGTAMPALRAAVFASEEGRCAAFVLAVSRLAFGGGFDLNEPETISEAAAASAISNAPCLHAAYDASRELKLRHTAKRLVMLGAFALPTLRVGRRIMVGEELIAEYLLNLNFSLNLKAPK